MLPDPDCRCHEHPPGEPCPSCQERYVDNPGGFPDEPPALDESAYFDACDLAELFEPSEADRVWHAEQSNQGS